MRMIRAQVRSQSNPDLSMPQFRTLAFIGRNPGAMLNDVAHFLALTPPAASKLVEGLFSTGLVDRDLARSSFGVGRADVLAVNISSVGSKCFGFWPNAIEIGGGVSGYASTSSRPSAIWNARSRLMKEV